MKLISKIEITNFRSIRNASLDYLGNYSILAGINNSGKSNFLRALNAFFTDKTDTNKPIDVDSDYYKPARKSKKKKVISIKVYFELPDSFKFRGELEEARILLGGSKFSITKKWYIDKSFPEVLVNNQTVPLSLIDRPKIDRFLSLISFRYIPNRVLPIEVIKEQHRALRDVLIRRLGKNTAASKVFKDVEEVSKKMIKSVSQDVSKMGTNIANVRLDTPGSWADMLFSFGYKLTENGEELDDSVQGSGIQSLLMFETLHLIDKDYYQQFGWRQAAIWAVEEPESSTHSSLEAQIAFLLQRIANENGGRLQVIGTSHSDLMIQYSDCCYLIEKSESRSFANRMNSSELLKRSARTGITKYSHPLLFIPHLPICLVEGKYDKVYLDKALELLGKQNDVKVITLSELTDGIKTGGVNDIQNYIINNLEIIKCRRKDSKVTLLLDWENEGSLREYKKYFSASDPFEAISWPIIYSNPELDTSFKGIERYYSTRIIELAREKGVKIGKNKEYFVSRDDYSITKSVLSRIVQNELTLEDITNVRQFILEKLCMITISIF